MKIAMGLVLACTLGGPAFAQDMHGHDMTAMVTPGAVPALKETGQSAFAAIAEATRLLEADPKTDWSKAKIGALRDHLVDMDNVTMRADVATTALANGARFQVTSNDRRVIESIIRMAHVHSAMAKQETPFAIAVEDSENGVTITVTGSTEADANRIRGLGYFGLLSEGNHHQRHHLALARGEEMRH